MIYQTHLSLPDGRYGILYRFPKAGLGLPMHSHAGPTANLQHHILCTQGKVLIHRENSSALEMHAGEDLRCGGEHFDSSLPHEIVALEDGSHVLNVFKHGRPEGYEKLPPHELDSSVEMKALTKGIT